MVYKVVYFSRGGTSKRVAEKIANRLSCESIEIMDNMNWKGFIGFIKGGYYASKNKAVEITYSKKLESFDALIVVSPLWAGGVVPAIKMFLKSVPNEEINLVMTSLGSLIVDRSGYASVWDVVKSKKNEDDIIKALVNNLKV